MIYWGTVDKNGRAVSGGNRVTRFRDGEYSISFAFNGSTVPAIVGSQTRYGKLDEANTDGIVFTSVFASGGTAITGNNVGTKEDRSFSFMAVGENSQTSTDRVLWGVVNSKGDLISDSGGVSVTKPDDAGQYVINFPNQFSSLPSIVATQTNSGSLSESNRDGIVVPLLSNDAAVLITGNNKSTPDNRSFSFIAIGERGRATPQPAATTMWGSINRDGTIAGGSGGFFVGRQEPGMYVITFPAFAKPPAIIGSQMNNVSADDRDGMVFPWVNTNYAIAVTGNANGDREDRSFSFIAYGMPRPR